jgi:hypothetical protein
VDLAALTTLSTNVHRGVALPIARAVVIVIPLTLLSVFWWLRRHR